MENSPDWELMLQNHFTITNSDKFISEDFSCDVNTNLKVSWNS